MLSRCLRLIIVGRNEKFKVIFVNKAIYGMLIDIGIIKVLRNKRRMSIIYLFIINLVTQ